MSLPSEIDADGMSRDGWSHLNPQNMSYDQTYVSEDSGLVAPDYTGMTNQVHQDSLVSLDQLPPYPQTMSPYHTYVGEGLGMVPSGVMGMNEEVHPHMQPGPGGNGSFDASVPNDFHAEGMRGPFPHGTYLHDYFLLPAQPNLGLSQQQLHSGWAPHTHNESFYGLQQHANQYASTHAHPAAALPPQPQRSSSNATLPPPSPSGNKRVPIERQKKHGSFQSRGSVSSSSAESPAGASDQAMVVQQSGPMSSSVTVPSRPRPGRKPMPAAQSDDRRRTQNRMAQRKFRDNRQQKLAEALEELEEMKRQSQQKDAEMKNELEECRKQMNAQNERIQNILGRLESAERQARESEQRALGFKKRAEDAEAELQAFKTKQQQLPSAIANFRPAYPVSTRGVNQEDEPTPPGSENGMEIDFTNWNRAGQSSYDLHHSATNDSNQMDYMPHSQVDDNCGFCSDSQNCVCAQEKAAAAAAAAAEKPAPVSVPGSCDQCRNDPVRAQACRDMAASTQISARPSTLDSARAQSTTAASGSMAPPPPRTCSNMIDTFNRYGERTATIASLFGGRRLNTYPASTGGGYEFQETEAAEVLSKLHRRSAVVESPRSVAGSVEDQRSPRTL